MTLKINPVLCREGMMDNYAYILQDVSTGVSAVVDASEAAPIVKCLNKLKIKPDYILTTHHHFDHVGGNAELKNLYQLKIIGPAQESLLIPELDIGLNDGDVFTLGESKMRVLSAAGHTKGHILFYFEKDKALFTGDVLFNLSIGAIFEGTETQMLLSLSKICALPDDVLFYPGHEYTSMGLSALSDSVESEKLYKTLALERLSKNKPVPPLTLGLEKQCNPYLRNIAADCHIFSML